MEEDDSSKITKNSNKQNENVDKLECSLTKNEQTKMKVGIKGLMKVQPSNNKKLDNKLNEKKEEQPLDSNTLTINLNNANKNVNKIVDDIKSNTDLSQKLEGSSAKKENNLLLIMKKLQMQKNEKEKNDNSTDDTKNDNNDIITIKCEDFSNLEIEYNNNDNCDSNKSNNITEDMINDIIEFIKKGKCTPLNKISENFNLNQNILISLLNKLESEGKLYGVIDDNNNYIHLSDDELSVK
jgi:hypothetical protein